MDWAENGQFPDISFTDIGEYMECKLQDSNTIDLGLNHPESTTFVNGSDCSPANTIYCIGCVNQNVITGFILSYGRDLNMNGISIIDSQAYKLQIRLPSHLFTRND